jgi:acyl carrier protein
MTWALLWVLFAVAGMTYVLVRMAIDRAAVRRRRRLLALRPPLDDRRFAETFFGDSPERARIAGRLRALLAANLKENLEGLHPEDRLDEDLYAELMINPNLFWDLEAEFGVRTPLNQADRMRAIVKSTRTFRDLVDYVERNGGVTR